MGTNLAGMRCGEHLKGDRTLTCVVYCVHSRSQYLYESMVESKNIACFPIHRSLQLEKQKNEEAQIRVQEDANSDSTNESSESMQDQLREIKALLNKQNTSAVPATSSSAANPENNFGFDDEQDGDSGA